LLHNEDAFQMKAALLLCVYLCRPAAPTNATHALGLSSAPVQVEPPVIQAHQVQCQLARQQLHI
jgi:hypothetical protein